MSVFAVTTCSSKHKGKCTNKFTIRKFQITLFREMVFFSIFAHWRYFTMPTIFDHISAKSKTAIRKTLRASLEDQFAQATSLVDALCGKMYATQIRHEECLKLYKDINCLLREIENTFANYAESRKCTIGIDDEGDISFMKKLLEEYKLKINQLKKGIEEAKQHEYRFDAKNKKESIKIYQSFLSHSEDITQRFETLQRQYNELENEVYGPQSDEVVLNRFNRHFYDVTQLVESSISVALSKGPSHSYGIFGDSLAAKVFYSISNSKENVSKRSIRDLQEELLRPIHDVFNGRFRELYDKPLKLAREIYEQQLDNELVEEIMTRLCLWQKLVNVCGTHSLKNFYKRRRGRPMVDRFYEEYLDLDKLGDFIRETFQERYHTSIEEDMRQGGKLSYAFLLAVLVALNGGDPSRVYGKVACFCRFLKKTFGALVRTVRSFQYYINKFVEFLRERNNGETARTVIVNDVERVVIRNKKFFSGEQLVSQVSGVLTQNEFISCC